MMKIEKTELERREWVEKEPNIWFKYTPDSMVTIDLQTGQGNITIYNSKHGKLELKFCASIFPGLSEIEIFCIRFILFSKDD